MSEKVNISQFANELMLIIPLIHKYVVESPHSRVSKKSDPLLQGKVTFPQYFALDMLDQNKRLRMNNLSGLLNISLPGTTGLVNRLIALGMVKRTDEEKDRRVVYISLTPKGKRVVQQTRTARKKIIEDMFSDLSDYERGIYLGILKKVRNNLYEKNRKK